MRLSMRGSTRLVGYK